MTTPLTTPLTPPATPPTTRPLAIGMIEVRGLVALAAGLDEMCKTAPVECVFIERVSGGYLVAGIRGELAQVQEAIDASIVAAQRHGELRRAQIYPRLHAEAEALLESFGSGSTEPAQGADPWPRPSR